MLSKRFVGLFVVLLASCALCLTAHGETPSTKPAAFFEKDVPRKVGHHRIMFHDTTGSQPVNVMTVFSISNTMAESKEKVPLMIFLCGVGERGDDGDGVFLNGPAGEMERNPQLRKTLPLVVMSPQCPEDHRWDDGAMVPVIVHAIEVAKKIPWIDTSRIYITGLSMGGKGTWLVAEAAPQLFAAVSPISAVAVDPPKAVSALKNVPTWIIVGAQDDDEFRGGSEQMAQTLKTAGEDVTFTELPDVAHNAWDKAYPRIEFYKWLLTAQQGKPVASDRASNEQLAVALNAPPTYFKRRMDREFKQFAQYWSLLNCGNYMQPGIRAQVNGKANVMVTHPLTPEIPCLMQTTWNIPSDRPAKLNLVVGCNPQGKWRLTVRADGKEILNQIVSPETTRNGWLETSVDLTPYKGRSLPLEVVNTSVDWDHSEAYFAKVSVDF